MREIKSLPDGLGQLREGDTTAELRFVNTKGETEVWILKGVDPVRLTGSSEAGIRGVVCKAYIDDGVDARLGLQREIIERLHRHILAHHDDDSLGAAQCKFSGNEA